MPAVQRKVLAMKVLKLMLWRNKIHSMQPETTKADPVYQECHQRAGRIAIEIGGGLFGNAKETLSQMQAAKSAPWVQYANGCRKILEKLSR